MATLLGALLHLQSVEKQIAHVRRRLKTRKYAVTMQERNVQQAKDDWTRWQEEARAKRAKADSLELELRAREEKVNSLRQTLNIAKTNKEYASVLTQINTLKADNARLEEEALRMMQEADAAKAQGQAAHGRIEIEQQRLEEINRTSAEDIRKLDAMLEELTAKRQEAAAIVPPEAMSLFERIADNYEGEAMALIEVHGKKPPYQYVCGGCYMSLNAEHANALRVRDEIRRCDNCGRILYLEQMAEQSATK